MKNLHQHQLIKVSIVEDHPMVISGLTNMLAPFEHIKIISHFSNGQDLLQELAKAQPDVILMDVMMPGMQGPELAREVKRIYPQIKILAVTSLDTPGQIRSMMQHGCSGYLLKNTDQNILLEAIEQVHAGEEYIEPALKEQMIQRLIQFKEKSHPETYPGKVVLTRREKEILQLITEEFTNQEIADKLFISPHTVDNHRISLLNKMQAKNTAGLVRKALEQGLVK
ncbi:MAG: response regulator transcription factor [Sphingobacteriales bacterium]|nr:MAG: response regulator transcription factor [Sphingobacteriales bacterium]